jgi:putative flavoprotein involved in K+ transport
VPHIPVVVVGAGHCGLAMSRHLAARAIDHVVLERGEVANSWRAERWDSLRLLTPNWLSRLPGQAYRGDDPDGYMTVAEVVDYLAAYAADAPVRTNTTVRTVRQAGAGFLVETDDGSWTADAVVVASGACNAPSLPAVAAELPADVPSLTAWGYRNPSQVPEGGVLVVGAAASGIQIADELQRAGRDVTIAVGEHVRVPRRYRGADILWCMEQGGVLGESWTEMDDLVRARSIPSMQLSGGGETLDLNALTARGARLAGRLQAIRGRRLLFSGSLRNVCALADLKLARLLDTLDAWALETGLEAPPPERFPRTAVPDEPVTELDLERDGIRSVLWATGYKAELSWLEAPVLNQRGRLIHDGGVTRVPGLYLIGMPFLRRRKSTLIDGADADARDLVEHLAAHLDAVVHGEGVAAAG